MDRSDETNVPLTEASHPADAQKPVEDLVAQLESELPNLQNERFGDYGDAISLRQHGVTSDTRNDNCDTAEHDELSSLQITLVDSAEVRDLRIAPGRDRQNP